MRVISIIVAVCLGLDLLLNFIGGGIGWMLRKLLVSGSLIVFFATFATKFNDSNGTHNTGSSQSKEENVNNSNEGAGGIKWLCLFIPLVGLILYFIWQSERPTAAKECGKFALIGVIISFSLAILSFIVSMAMIGSMGY